jgi:hypothetical protein
MNCNALLDGFEVRRAMEEDYEGVSALVSGMQNSEAIKEAFKSAEGDCRVSHAVL